MKRQRTEVIQSKVFKAETVVMCPEVSEQVIIGGRDKLPLLPKAFATIRQVGIIGFGSQGKAHAQNLRDSLRGTSIKVKVGLKRDGKSWPEANALGFTEEGGTLGETVSVIQESDLVIMLIPDSDQAALYREIFRFMKSGATLGLAHGFLLGYLQSIGKEFPEHFNVIGVCPKGVGPSVRGLYTQGSGINCSFAVERDVTGTATDIALAWAIAIGAPFVFKTTLEMEFRSDIFGERAVLLGGVYGLAEALFEYSSTNCFVGNSARYVRAVTTLGPISEAIKRGGLLGLYEEAGDKREFEMAYRAAYHPFYVLMREIYDEVRSGREIASVVDASERMKIYPVDPKSPMGVICDTPMWQTGRYLRQIELLTAGINPMTAGLYCAMMMAQCNLLWEEGHSMSEISNESVLEAVWSLLPYMLKIGIDSMVDNCSTTARLGTRKWGPRFRNVTTTQVFPAFDKGHSHGLNDVFKKFLENPIHSAIQACSAMQPAINLEV